jgi:hypothetical protein
MLSCAFLTACSDLYEDDLDVKGSWVGAATLKADGCLLGEGVGRSFVHAISQDDDDISVLDDEGNIFAGELSDDNDGFSVDSVSREDFDIGNENRCSLITTIDYNVEDDEADVTIETNGNCGDDFSCSTVYEGKSSRLHDPDSEEERSVGSAGRTKSE